MSEKNNPIPVALTRSTAYKVERALLNGEQFVLFKPIPAQALSERTVTKENVYVECSAYAQGHCGMACR